MKYLSLLCIKSAFISAIECFDQNCLFELMLSKLGYSHSCSDRFDFIRFIANCHKLDNFVLVVDKAERLRDKSLVDFFAKLQELTGKNVSVVLISSLNIKYFGSNCSPIFIHFPPYAKNDLMDILIQDYESNEFNKRFVELIYSVFYKYCDLVELLRISKSLYGKYCEPIEMKSIEATDDVKLYKNIQPLFKDIINKKSFRDDKDQKFYSELPNFTKFILVAAYLASYNPPRIDLILFTNEKKTKNRRLISSTGKVNQSLLGPRSFPLERLRAILKNIYDDSVIINTSNFLTQISSLVSMNLLLRASSYDNLDSLKYRVNVTFDFICQVSRDVDIDIKKYLYEYQ